MRASGIYWATAFSNGAGFAPPHFVAFHVYIKVERASARFTPNHWVSAFERRASAASHGTGRRFRENRPLIKAGGLATARPPTWALAAPHNRRAAIL